jgi:PAS domain S-box-containing protein
MAELTHPLHPTDLGSLEQLVADWPDAVFVFDSDSQRYLFVNDAAERLVGYAREEILQLQPRDLSHPDDAREIPAVAAQAEREGWVRRPWRALRKDGTVVQTEMTLTRRRIDDRVLSQGIFRVVGDGMLVGAGTDVSTIERLKILERTRLAVVTLDREGVVTSWNAGATEQFRLAAHETVGRRVLDLARNEEDRAYVESLMSPHIVWDEWVSKLTIHPSNDAAYEAMVACSAIRSDDGELNGFLFVTAPLEMHGRKFPPRMRRARVQCAACGLEVAGTMRRKYCSEKCRQWAYYHRHLDAQRERSRQRHERRRGGPDDPESLEHAADGSEPPGNCRP